MDVGGGRDVVAVPLPPSSPVAERPSMTASLAFLSGALLVDEWSDPVAAELSGLADEARAMTAAAARFDARLASAYVWGAAELAARSGDHDERRRQEWGARGMLAELAATLHIAEGTLARRLTRITMLAAFPELQSAHTAGVVSAAHVDAVLDAFHGVVDPEALGAADVALVDRACRLTAPQLRAAARRWRSRHVPPTPQQRARAAADRFVDVTPADDDLCWLTALLPATAALGVLHRIDDLAAAVAGPDEARTPAQLRADVLCDLILAPDALHLPAAAETRRATAGDDESTEDLSEDPRCQEGPAALPSWVRGIVPQVVLTVPALSLLGRSDEPAELDGFGPIDLETARVLCAHAPTFTRVLTHPETGAVLSVGRDRYAVPADLRRAVAMRDQTCRFPGCRRRASRCDVDHSIAWADGGTTDLDNLATLCRKHHRLKHEAGWRVVHEVGGTLRWHSPTGRRYGTRPATVVWPPPAPLTGADGDLGLSTHAGGACPGATPAAGPPGYPEAPPF